jgi:hypothetical protein
MQAAMDKIFDALGREHPELYNKVYDAVKAAAENEKALKNGGTE